MHQFQFYRAHEYSTKEGLSLCATQCVLLNSLIPGKIFTYELVVSACSHGKVLRGCLVFFVNGELLGRFILGTTLMHDIRTLLLHCSTSLDTEEWKTSISRPSLPYVLKMLTGLCHWHSKTQEALLSVVGELHSLEQVASDQHIGTLAENLLEAMMENKACEEEVRERGLGVL